MLGSWVAREHVLLAVCLLGVSEDELAARHRPGRGLCFSLAQFMAETQYFIPVCFLGKGLD